MSVQPDDELVLVPNWSGWLDTSINGAYPLRRLLSSSEHGAVFLTECEGRADPPAAVKIIPIDRVTLAQLQYWKAAIGLSHPHLIRLFDAGLCQLGGRQFLFVVMEYAEQTLPQVLRHRALTPEEAKELLPPILDALRFLHGQGLVHGHLKPANVLVVNDQLKLSSDGIRPDGAPRVGLVEPTDYDPPEANQVSFSSAGDLWGLGVTLFEALTRHPPRFDAQSVPASLPTTVSPELVEIVDRCLSANPDTRPSIADLEARLAGAPMAPIVAPAPGASTPLPEPAAPEPVPESTPMQQPARRQRPMGRVAALLAIVVVAACWAGWHLFSRHPGTAPSQQPAVVAATVALPPPSPITKPPTAILSTSAIYKPLPNIPRRALGTIHGHFRIVVVVVVDPSGHVISDRVKSPGPSAYFARRTREAARQWTFPASDQPGTRDWQLNFEFMRSGVTAEASPGT